MSWPKGKKHSEKQKERIRLKLQNFYKDPKARKRISMIKRLQYKTNPELRKKIDKIITGWWKDNPNIRKERSKKIKQFFIKNPKAFREFLKHGKNPLKRHIRTKQGFLVRSNGEKQIADFLYRNKIKSSYEAIDLPIIKEPFNGNICNPDFYLPEYKIFIEFYGGYPKAWKKKVLKNKIYRTHKIPVIAITPAELEDLNYYLLKEAEKLSKTNIVRNFQLNKKGY